MKALKKTLLYFGLYISLYTFVWALRMYCKWEFDSYFWVLNKIPHDESTRAIFPLSILAYIVMFMFIDAGYDKDKLYILNSCKILLMFIALLTIFITEIHRL